MSAAHHQLFERIRDEHKAVVAALELVSRQSKLKGVPAYKSGDLEVAIASAGDAYALLLIASAEGFLRQYLLSLGKLPGEHIGLHSLIEKTYKEFNSAAPAKRIRSEEKSAFQELRLQRNTYAHGLGTNVFPSIPSVAATLSRFFHNLPRSLNDDVPKSPGNSTSALESSLAPARLKN